ncbi:MAG: glutamine--fructose-6-phosphate transaminase (isomerizing) [Lentisphaerae bacterium]|nr:glutamine--fructose-6-phosphate transaminase (isomerizing) [Lentisphaerota bacterium]
MCGIVGYIGQRNATGVIISGLKRLEYRGYDSAGLALYSSRRQALVRVRAVGKIAGLVSRIETDLPDHADPDYTLGVGHTRWATHGAPTEANAHPHLSRNGEFAVVHNGIIENYAALKERLIRKGYIFTSETDTEVLAHLVEECYEGDLHCAVAAALEQVEGTYGIAVVGSRHQGLIIAARKGSPIAIGAGQSEAIVASDISAIIGYTKQVVFLNDEDIATITAETLDIASLKNVPVSRALTHIDSNLDQIEKGGFEHFMLKEIHEQPQALANAIRGRLLEKDGTTRLGGMQMTSAEIARISHISIAACGTSYYAGMVGKYLFEDLAGLPTDIEQAAEFRYRNPIIEPDTLMLAISQSGETADTIAAVREALRKGATVLGICNVVGSTIARDTGRGVYLHAGPEIGVASTKAFTAQVAVLAMLAIIFGRARRLSGSKGRELVRELTRAPAIVAAMLEEEGAIKVIAEKYARSEHMFYLGRGYMYPAALEGALKLKEISYIHAEGYHAAELKHGPIALLDEHVPVVVAVPDLPGKSKTISNMQECRARGSSVIAIATSGDDEAISSCNDVIRVPRCLEFLAPIPVVIAEQLLAYHIARFRGCPIDQPRNLAKSVTVE